MVYIKVAPRRQRQWKTRCQEGGLGAMFGHIYDIKKTFGMNKTLFVADPVSIAPQTSFVYGVSISFTTIMFMHLWGGGGNVGTMGGWEIRMRRARKCTALQGPRRAHSGAGRARPPPARVIRK